jgi:hypothetical protein
MNTKTREEIEALKQDWHADPCWDIEETEGFEAHREELEAYRLECEAAWQQAYEAESAALAVEIGHPGNLDLARQYQVYEREVRLQMTSATDLLTHYFEQAGVEMTGGAMNEIGFIVEALVDAAAAKAACYTIKRTGNQEFVEYD